MRNELLLLAVAAHDRLERAAQRERAVERVMIEDCVRDKSAMPEHAWQTRHIAEEKARAAYRLVEAIAGA